MIRLPGVALLHLQIMATGATVLSELVLPLPQTVAEQGAIVTAIQMIMN